jgi:hypothetical protein
MTAERENGTRFPLPEFGLDSFNSDNRAAELNAGSFRSISKGMREAHRHD